MSDHYTVDELHDEIETLTAEVEALEIEVNTSQITITRFLAGEAPVTCNQCHEKLYNCGGVLWCAKCKRGWDPREGDWTWSEYKEE